MHSAIAISKLEGYRRDRQLGNVEHCEWAFRKHTNRGIAFWTDYWKRLSLSQSRQPLRPRVSTRLKQLTHNAKIEAPDEKDQQGPGGTDREEETTQNSLRIFRDSYVRGEVMGVFLTVEYLRSLLTLSRMLATRLRSWRP